MKLWSAEHWQYEITNLAKGSLVPPTCPACRRQGFQIVDGCDA
jgi:hypothetical protein